MIPKHARISSRQKAMSDFGVCSKLNARWGVVNTTQHHKYPPYTYLNEAASTSNKRFDNKKGMLIFIYKKHLQEYN